MAAHGKSTAKARSGRRTLRDVIGKATSAESEASSTSVLSTLRTAAAGVPATVAHRLRGVGEWLVSVVANAVHGWLHHLGEAVANASPGVKAAVEGIAAALKGQKPLWAAIKGAVSGLSRRGKVTLIAALALALLLGPVLLIVAVLALIVAGIVAAVRSARRPA